MPATLSARLRSAYSASRRLVARLSAPPSSTVDTRFDLLPPDTDPALIGWRAADTPAIAPQTRITLAAFYLPQFHPIPENDAWWGKGFTEWTNVTRASPRFEGHWQPQLPGELGQYDLRKPDVMHRQVEMALAHGVGAFCFYYYWFAGRRVLERPVDQYFADSSLKLHYCLCWANEPWTRRWDGREQDVLLAQTHGAEDDLAFIESMLPFFRDPRYLKWNGKPVLLLYRAELLPDPQATSERWRSRCREAGIGEIHLACVESFQRRDPRDFGFDAAVEFPPNLVKTGSIEVRVASTTPNYSGEVLDWRKMAAQFRERQAPPYLLHRGVNVAWDNEARRPGRGRSFVHASPRRYEDWLRTTVDEQIGPSHGDHPPLVFINAWNEWAEGAHLEPDARLGYAWLQATRRAVTEARPPPSRPCIVLHIHHLAVAAEILEAIAASGIKHRLLVTTSTQDPAPLEAILEASCLQATIHVFDNRGRDLLPFLHLADRLLDEGEDLVLKLHTKRSPHLADGDLWRRELIEQLLTPARALSILEAFRLDPRLGLVGPAGHLLDARRYLSSNRAGMDYIVRRMGWEPASRRPGIFFAGSMYWLRLHALRPLLDTHLHPEQFEAEAGQLDGTLAHALERLVGDIVEVAGFRLADSADPQGPAPAIIESGYRYAP